MVFVLDSTVLFLYFFIFFNFFKYLYNSVQVHENAEK